MSANEVGSRRKARYVEVIMLRPKHERLRRGWNQTTLAFHSGLSVPDVSKIETGRMRPYRTQLDRLSAVLGVDGALLLQDCDQHKSGWGRRLETATPGRAGKRESGG